MKLHSKYIEQAVEQISTLPGIGKRTALRLVLNLLNRSEDEVKDFTDALTEMKRHVKQCKSCGNIADSDLCSVCTDHKRDQATICVVEDIRDILAIEATESYKGVYHVLGGIISPMDGIGPSDLNIQLLVDRCATGKIDEVIFALSATMEGDTTNFYLSKRLKGLELRLSVLSRGVSVGTELQYTDELTLGRSLLNRQPFIG